LGQAQSNAAPRGPGQSSGPCRLQLGRNTTRCRAAAYHVRSPTVIHIEPPGSGVGTSEAHPQNLRPFDGLAHGPRRHGVRLACVVLLWTLRPPGGVSHSSCQLDRDGCRTNERGEEVGIELYGQIAAGISLQLPSARGWAAQDRAIQAGTPSDGRSCRPVVCARQSNVRDQVGIGGDPRGDHGATCKIAGIGFPSTFPPADAPLTLPALHALRGQTLLRSPRPA
jgi:hypothetical protein